jgi:hypothetical protein
MIDERQQQHFETRANQVWRWHATALEFISAANCLHDWYMPILEKPPADRQADDAFASFEPMMLLYATAAENLLKAIRIAQGQEAVTDGRLSPRLCTHALLALADDAKLAMTSDERALLAKLKDVLEAGKYPIAKRADQGAGAWIFEHPGDPDRILDLLTRLQNDLGATGAPCFLRQDIRLLGRRCVPASAGKGDRQP